jgi:myo-inositol-1(or 4)-monophosphatase
MDYTDLLRRARALITNTGDWIRAERVAFSSDRVEEKGLNNLVSYVDKEAERKLVAGLQTILPGCGFLTEEGTIDQDPDASYIWIIDPLDGTTNFIHGIPFYCVSVALAYRDELVLGMIYDPNLQEFFHAIQGQGAFLNGDRIQVSKNPSLARSVVATGFPHRNFEGMEAYIQSLEYFFRNTRSLRRLGAAALDLAYIACGRMDSFFELKLMPWDIAAGAVLVREAGGIITDFDGNPMLQAANQILAGNPAVYQETKNVLDRFFAR